MPPGASQELRRKAAAKRPITVRGARPRRFTARV
jgi:hypothetical protein